MDTERNISQSTEKSPTRRHFMSDFVKPILGRDDKLIMVNVIDVEALEAIRSLQDSSDPHFVRQFYDLYLDSSEKLLRSLVKAIDAGDACRVRSEAQSLKSSSSQAGFVELTRLCRELEAVGSSESLVRASALLKDLLKEYNRCCSAVLALPEMAGRKAA